MFKDGVMQASDAAKTVCAVECRYHKRDFSRCIHVPNLGSTGHYLLEFLA